MSPTSINLFVMAKVASNRLDRESTKTETYLLGLSKSHLGQAFSTYLQCYY